MNKIFIIFLIPFLLPDLLSAQSKKNDCEAVKQGTFYFYPPKSQERYLIARNSSVQTEINTKTSDTSFWKVNWVGDCVLHLKFIRSSQLMSNTQKSFLNSRTTVIKVLEVTKDYYVFKGGVDSITAKNTSTDTLWRKEK